MGNIDMKKLLPILHIDLMLVWYINVTDNAKPVNSVNKKKKDTVFSNLGWHSRLYPKTIELIINAVNDPRNR